MHDIYGIVIAVYVMIKYIPLMAIHVPRIFIMAHVYHGYTGFKMASKAEGVLRARIRPKQSCISVSISGARWSRILAYRLPREPPTSFSGESITLHYLQEVGLRSNTGGRSYGSGLD